MTVSRRGALLVGAGLGAAAVGGGYAVATHDKPEPPAPSTTDAKGHLLWRNWSGVQHAYPAARLAPKTEGELTASLKTAAAPIRPVGAGHSFTALVPTDGTLVSLDALSGIIAWEGDEAVVAAGTRLGALGPVLAAKGRAMANLPDINKQALAGALATGTHGTGAKIQALHGDVTALRLVTPKGEVLDCDANKNADVFQAAKVSLGALGVITQVRLKTTANRRLERNVWLEPFEDALAKAEERWARHRNFEFYAVPFTGLAACISHDETDAPALPRGPDQDTVFLDVLKGLRNLLGFSAPLRKTAARALLGGTKPEKAIDEGWKLLSTERPVRFNEMEFHLPAERAVEGPGRDRGHHREGAPRRLLPDRMPPHRPRRRLAVAVSGRAPGLHRRPRPLQGRVRLPLHPDRADLPPIRRPAALGQAAQRDGRPIGRALSALERLPAGSGQAGSRRPDAQSVPERPVRGVATGAQGLSGAPCGGFRPCPGLPIRR
jgi:FAD-linked oxidoreductase